MIKRSFLFIVLLFGVNTISFAQFIFQILKPSDGLSSREAKSVYKDDEGFLWIGTSNGLNRYDGNNFKIWNHQLAGYPEHLGEDVYTIIEHGKDKIWFGTNAGIGILDKTNHTISEAKFKNKLPGVKAIAITKLCRDKLGRLWMASLKGVYPTQAQEC